MALGSDLMEGGFFILWREMFEHPIWLGLTAGQRLVMITTIEMANWKPTRFWSTKLSKEITVNRGSFVSSQETIARRAKVTRKVVNGALRQLEAADFISRTKLGRNIHLITVSNYSKYQNVPGAEGRTRNEAGSPKGRRRVAEGVWLEQGEQGEQGEPTTTEEGQLLPGLRPDNPLADAVATADHLWRALVDSGQPTPGYTREPAYLRRRKDWATELRACEHDYEVTQDEIRQAIDWAMSAPPFEVKGKVWSWPEVLACAEPAKKLRAKLPILLKHSAKTSSKGWLEVEKYTPGPGAPAMYYRHAVQADGSRREVNQEEFDALQKQGWRVRR